MSRAFYIYSDRAVRPSVACPRVPVVCGSANPLTEMFVCFEHSAYKIEDDGTYVTTATSVTHPDVPPTVSGHVRGEVPTTARSAVFAFLILNEPVTLFLSLPFSRCTLLAHHRWILDDAQQGESQPH